MASLDIHPHWREEHLEVFENLLKMHADAGIKLRGHKTKIFRDEVEYLGHVVNKDGTRMHPPPRMHSQISFGSL